MSKPRIADLERLYNEAALGAVARAAKAEDTQRTRILAGELRFPRDTEQCDATLRELYEALDAFDWEGK